MHVDERKQETQNVLSLPKTENIVILQQRCCEIILWIE